MATRGTFQFPSRPLPLIEIRGEDELVVNEETALLLSKIECPVCPVVVVGLYRTGKSTLLNMLRRELDDDTAAAEDDDDDEAGFEVGPSVERCTRGIWVWGRPLFAYENGGERPTKAALLLDTEGVGGLEADAQYDARIFALSCLVASSLVYNSLGSIDEHAISQLSFVARLSEHVTFFSSSSSRGGGGGGGDDDANRSDESEAETVSKLSEFMPSFTWVVRDFSLELASSDGEAITADEYLEAALRPQRGYDASALERNRLRHVIKAFFRSRACRTLVRPCVDETDLSFVDRLDDSKLRPRFLRELDEFRDHLFAPEKLQPKTLGLGKHAAPLRGPAYVELLHKFCDSFNSGGVPAVVGAWDHVSKIESDAALEEALDEFDNVLSAALQEEGPSSSSSSSSRGSRKTTTTTTKKKKKKPTRTAAAEWPEEDDDDDDDEDDDDDMEAEMATSSSRTKEFSKTTRQKILEADDLEGAVGSATKAADAVFRRRALGDAARDAELKLHDTIRARATDARRANKRASTRFCDDLAARLYVDTVAASLDRLATVRLLDDDALVPSACLAPKSSKNGDGPPRTTKKKKKKKSSSADATTTGPTTTTTGEMPPSSSSRLPRDRPSSGIPLSVEPAELAARLGSTWSEFRRVYAARAKGPAAESCLLSFLADKWPESCQELVRRLEAMHDLDRAREQAKTVKLKSQLAEYRGQTDARAKMLEDAQQSLITSQLDKAKMEARADAGEKQLKKQRRDANRHVKDLEAQIATLELQLDDAERDKPSPRDDKRVHVERGAREPGFPKDHNNDDKKKKQADVVDHPHCKPNCLIS